SILGVQAVELIPNELPELPRGLDAVALKLRQSHFSMREQQLGKAAGARPDRLLVPAVGTVATELDPAATKLVDVKVIAQRDQRVSEEVSLQPQGLGEGVAAELADLPAGDDAPEPIEEGRLP